ncbi:Cell division control protein 1 [Smittium culicis]|uniref:Cell division control protein 1 n=1 Tax=Smittium culicis TaxID=133412 RepID=A0A1R1YEX4_9FUNG|nr:Cell division control protein 1 [Smittium culicis]
MVASRRHRPYLLAFRIYWILLLLFGEVYVFYSNINNIEWPTKDHWNTNDHETTLKFGIIADPQLVDYNSYKHTGAHLFFEQLLTDNYISKHYYFLKKLKTPDNILFLGDLMDGGREWTDSTWNAEWNRFQSIFKPDNESSSKKVKLHFVAGNHDIGVGDTIVNWALQRYRHNVGELNYAFEANGHAIIVLDTISYENSNSNINSESRRFLDYVSKEYSHMPKVLFTHIPMWRPKYAVCGPLRQSKNNFIAHGKGFQYKTVLEKDATFEILNKLRPDIIFSGDDHDNCHHIHEIKNKKISEVIVFTLYI